MDVKSVDAEGTLQATVLTRWELAKLSAHALSLRRSPWEASTIGWSGKLRTLGQLLERQEAEASHVWGGPDQLRVAGAQGSRPVQFICRRADLEEWDRAQRAPRVLRALRERVVPGGAGRNRCGSCSSKRVFVPSSQLSPHGRGSVSGSPAPARGAGRGERPDLYPQVWRAMRATSSSFLR